jgi:transposase
VVELVDATSAGRRVTVRWRKRRWRCAEPDCGRKTWTEQHDAVGARRRSTVRCRVQVATAVARGRSVAEASAEVGLGWRAGMRAVADEAFVPDRLRPVTRLGVDETVSRRRRRFVTHLVDLDAGTVIVTVEGRSQQVLLDALAAQGAGWLAGVAQVAIDPFAAYAAAVRRLVPNARLVVDKWHILRLFARAVDQVRRRTVQEQAGRRGRKIDRLWTARMLLLTRFERLSQRQRERLFDAVELEDPDGQVSAAYIAYQEALLLLDRHGTVGLRSALGDVFARLAHLEVPELVSLGRTLDRWLPELIAIFETGTTNAATEGCNRKVKQIKRVACGFRNHDNYALRIAIHAGVKTTYGSPRRPATHA